MAQARHTARMRAMVFEDVGRPRAARFTGVAVIVPQSMLACSCRRRRDAS
jgi:hypothetical protein